MFWKIGAVLLVSLAFSSVTLVEGNRCDCPKNYRLVCGSDGVTYHNDCILKCQNPNAEVVHEGPCIEKIIHERRSVNLPKCTCPRHLDPVCGTNGVTYPNLCELECVYPKVQLSHKGKCETCSCPFIYRPVCGTDGKTYGNPCHFECQRKEQPDLKLLHCGPCREA